MSRSWVMTTTVVPARVQVPQQRQDAGAGGRVEVAGRLVGEHERRRADDRAGDRDALPLAAGQLGAGGA